MIKDYRIGERFDATSFAAKYGCEVPDEVMLAQVKYSYKEYFTTYEGVEHTIQVSNDGMILGTWTALPFDKQDPRAEINSLVEVLKDLYADKLIDCGAKESKVQIKVRHEPDAKKIVVDCQDVDFAALIKKNNDLAGCTVHRRRGR